MIIYIAGNPGGTGRIPALVKVAKDRLLTFYEMDYSPGFKGTLSEFLRRVGVMKGRAHGHIPRGRRARG